MSVNVNKHGYLVTYLTPNKEYRTYACSNLVALKSLVFRLTGREYDSYPEEQSANLHNVSYNRDNSILDGLASVPNVKIAYPLHIYGD